MTSVGVEGLLGSWKRSLHDKSPGTVTLYVEIAQRFARFLAEQRGSDDFTTVTRRDVEHWFDEMRTTGLSQSTMRSRWIALRSLYRWLEEEDELPGENPMTKVKVAKAEPGPLPIPTEADLRAILATCSGRSMKDRRDNAVIRVMASTGLRLAEVCALEIGDVDLDARCLVVRRGKGDKFRLVRFDEVTAAAIDRYLRVRARSPHASEPWLWLSRITDAAGGHQYKRRSIPSMLTWRANKAGVPHVHPHAIRHFWTDQWFRRGGTESDLLQLGGWENAEIMRRYGRHHAVERALSAYDNIKPSEGLR